MKRQSLDKKPPSRSQVEELTCSGEIRRKLYRWYVRHQRALPWRNTSDPYRIWVSEIMLQQTQVVRVVDYYQKFIRRFPDVYSLADARWNDILKYWRGLGYYHRARSMQHCAKLLCREFRGCFPRERCELERLPGIGSYTAAAIASFAFGAAHPAIDTNLYRVAMRYTGKNSKGADTFLNRLFSRSRKAAQLNHALMDLGATLCQAHKTHCACCPLSGGCSTANKPLVCQPPRKKNVMATRRVIDVGAACIHRGGSYLIAKRTRKKGGLWEFVGGKREKGESLRAALKREVQEEIGVEISVRPAFLVQSARALDGRKIRLHFCRAQILRGRPKKTEHSALRWVHREDLQRYAFPAANKKAIEFLQSHFQSKK